MKKNRNTETPFDMEWEPEKLNLWEKDETSSKLAAMKIRYLMMSEEERISPDTYVCECMFLEDFVTEEMGDDFPLIARDFLLHELENLGDYHLLSYVDEEPSESWPENAFQNMILNLMLGAVKQGSEYARALFCNLHKTYYKREYKLLKRFSSISADEVAAVAYDDEEYSPYSLARVMCCARMYGIELKPDCHLIYLYLDEWYPKPEKNEDRFLDFPEGFFEQCREQVEKLFEDRKGMEKQQKRMDRFLSNALKYFGYSTDYVDLCDDDYYGEERNLSRAMAVLKKIYPDREITGEELVFCGGILHCIGALTSVSEQICESVKEVLNICDPDYYEEYTPLFDPAKTIIKGREPERKPQQTVVVKKTEAREEQAYSQEALLREIESLRARLHRQEEDNKNLHHLYDESRKLLQEQEGRMEQQEREHMELAALREHVYHFTEYDETAGEEDIARMKRELANRKLVIIGGHANWVKKLKQEFPSWTYISPKASGTVDSKLVQNAEHVYFFTDTIAHTTYNRFIQEVRECHVPFGYIHGVNIDTNVMQIYGELAKA